MDTVWILYGYFMDTHVFPNIRIPLDRCGGGRGLPRRARPTLEKPTVNVTGFHSFSASALAAGVGVGSMHTAVVFGALVTDEASATTACGIAPELAQAALASTPAMCRSLVGFFCARVESLT